MRANPGKGVTLYQVCRLFGIAYGKASTVSTTENWFRKSSICPINSMVFNHDNFCPAEVTDRPLSLQENSNNNLSVERCRDFVPPLSPQNDMLVSAEPLQVIHGNTPKSAMVNAEEISFLPKGIVKPGMSRRKCFKSLVLTSSPDKRSLLSKTTNSSNAINKKLTKKSAKKQISFKTANQVCACVVCGG